MSELHTSTATNQQTLSAVQNGEVAGTAPTPVDILTSSKVEILVPLLESKFITSKEYKITFRGVSEKKQKELAAAGKPVPVKRPEFKIALPIITLEGLQSALADTKQRDYVLSVLEAEVYKEARYQIDDNTPPVNSQSELDVSLLTLSYLANQPPSERRGGGISKETWEAFAEDFINVMPGLSGDRPVEKIQMAASIFVKRLAPVRGKKKVVQFLKDQLALWFQHTQAKEDFADCYLYLDGKCDEYLTAEEDLLANLQ
jgi:hypothetical protein